MQEIKSKYLEKIEKELKQRFAGEGEIRFFRAPGRVDWLGSHTDYNFGLILASTVDREIFAGARLRDDGVLNLYSINLDMEVRINIEQNSPDPAHSWANYPKGVIAQLKERGIEISGMDLVFYGDVPIGANLSSSAALEAVTLEAVVGFLNCQLSLWERAFICFYAENKFVGMPCGILDQFTIYMGGENSVLFLDCDRLSSERIEVDFEKVQLLVVDSGVGRELVKSEYSKRREECEKAFQEICSLGYKIRHLSELSSSDLADIEGKINPLLFRRVRHIITENERVKKAKELIKSKDYKSLGELLNQGYYSSSRDYENSIYELDLLFELLSKTDAVLGARIAGAGWGGCMVALVENFSPEEFEATVKEPYEKKTQKSLRYFLVKTSSSPGEIDA